MQNSTLKHNFIVFQWVGLWRPEHWPPGYRTKLYNLYTIFMVFFISTITLSEFINLIVSINDIEAVVNNLFILMTMLSICGKGANILKKRYELIGLTNVLEKYPCQPLTIEESKIQMKFDGLNRFNSLRYAALTGAGVTVIVMSSILEDTPRHTLPFNSWLPYNHSSSFGYWIAYVHQVSAHVIGAGINVAFDTLIPGLMIQTCGQLNILKHRIRRVPEAFEIFHDREEGKSDQTIDNPDAMNLVECIRHHQIIFKFAKTSNDIFSLMILSQYIVSIIVLCVSVFQLSQLKLFSSEFTSIFGYIACMSVQVYQLCFYGNEVTLESQGIGDGIYDMDWISFSTEIKRSLVVFMICTQKPIKFTSFSVLTLDLESFNSLVKLSYSAYNVLQQSS